MQLSRFTPPKKKKKKAQLMLTNPRDAFRGQSKSPNIVPFHMLGIVSYWCAVATFGTLNVVPFDRLGRVSY